MKNLEKNLIKILAILVLVFCFYTPVSAQLKDYTVLAPLPGTTKSDGTTDFKTYLPGMFKLIISIGAVLAFVMITYGGFLYATSDAISGRETGKEYVTNAIYGLVFVIGAWVILNTINPKILAFDLTFQSPTLGTAGTSVTSGGATGWYPLTPEMLLQDKVIRDDFWNSSSDGKRIHVNTTSPCSTQGVVTGCSNLVGLPNNAISDTKQLNKNCNCEILITGGTEGGHASHGPGKPIMDMAITTDLSNYIITNGGTPIQTSLGPQYTINKDGVSATFLRETNPNHWHVVFK